MKIWERLSLLNPYSMPETPSDDWVSNANAASLHREIQWFTAVVELRFKSYFEKDSGDIYQLEPPNLEGDPSPYARLAAQLGFGFQERIVLILAMLPHLRPQILDAFFIPNEDLNRGYCEFGGWQGKHHGGFLPTCETAAFILSGRDLALRFKIQRLFEPDHDLTRQQLLSITPSGSGEPLFASLLSIHRDALMRLTTGVCHKPDFSTGFPARRLTTPLEWNDLSLGHEARRELEKVQTWIQFGDRIMIDWGLNRILQPGYRALFHGPPGTGKTLTAALMGKALSLDVYRIDLAAIVSKYIGETEKNLSALFDQAETKRWILFFDEADTLFGKRTSTQSVNDRHANQETAYLLQRIESFPGAVILATNLKDNIDPAFFRRFQSQVYFPLPDETLRLQLWRNSLEHSKAPVQGLDLPRLARDFELSGGAIGNAVRHGALAVLGEGRRAITQNDLLAGIELELKKEGRTSKRDRIPKMVRTVPPRGFSQTIRKKAPDQKSDEA